ncbi:Reverse transcriptase zinc-binding domain [Sesbania bispinosa]|nr:Reverse transcriptase zinc-binding domain [Sesbania bispinosa]
MPLHGLPRLSMDGVAALTSPVSKDEVRTAVMTMGTCKAPGPDGGPDGFQRLACQIQRKVNDGEWQPVSYSSPRPDSGYDPTSIPYFSSAVHDGWTLISSSSGVYSVKAGHHWLLESDCDWPLGDAWRCVWRLRAPEKVRHLIWLISHQAIPTNEKWWKCNLTTSPACGRCSHATEDVDHCLRSCLHAAELWNRTGLTHHLAFHNSEVIGWIKGMVASTKGSLFLAALWWQWRWCNNMLLDENKWSINQVLRMLYHSADEYVDFLGTWGVQN